MYHDRAAAQCQAIATEFIRTAHQQEWWGGVRLHITESSSPGPSTRLEIDRHQGKHFGQYKEKDLQYLLLRVTIKFSRAFGMMKKMLLDLSITVAYYTKPNDPKNFINPVIGRVDVVIPAGSEPENFLNQRNKHPLCKAITRVRNELSAAFDELPIIRPPAGSL